VDWLMLASRAIAEERMDDDHLDAETYAAVVHDLAKVNTLTIARRPTIKFLAAARQRLVIKRMAALQKKDETLRHRLGSIRMKILDVGFGDGDMLRSIGRWAARNAVDATLVGIDLNPRSARAANEATPAELKIDYRTGDYADLASDGWDVILSSLVAHHMTHEQLVGFIRFMEAEAQAGWFINDLHRHSFAYLGFPLLATIMRWHPIVRHDGQLSIARSYRPHEWPAILEEAGIQGATIARKFPFRLCVSKIR
jgi:2-polyprenyl-3-methyl-5-hydroxy-6-metoxy-1,4-benzoquinol methylase